MAHKMVAKEKRRHISLVIYAPDEALEWGETGYRIADRDRLDQRYDEIVAYLDSLRVKCCISPLHYADVYDEDTAAKWVRNHAKRNGGKLSDEDEQRRPKAGMYKKPHWHIYYYSGGGKTLSGMRKMFARFGVTTFWVEDDREVAIRYQCHLDSEGKATYDPTEVRAFGGLDVSCLWKLDKADKLDVISMVCMYIRDNECTNYFDLTNAMLELEDPELFDCLISKVAFFSNYMAGLQMKMQARKKTEG